MSERQTNDLWVAVDDSDVVKVKTLLQQGTDPNDPVFWTEEWWSKDCGKSRARRPPLHTACYNGNIEIIQLLLQAGAKVDKSEGQDNRTPFFQACRGGHKDVVDYLIKEFGPTIAAKDENDRTPLHFACSGGHKELVKYFLQEYDIEARDNKSLTPFLYVCGGGQIDVFLFLVEECNCNVDVKSTEDVTPLHFACVGGNKEIVQYLLQKLKLDVDVKAKENVTPLHMACAAGHKEIVEYLVQECKCDINLRGEYNSTPLHYASEYGHKEIVQYFIEELKCDVDVTDDSGYTPLDRATKNNHTETIEYLKPLSQSSKHPVIKLQQQYVPQLEDLINDKDSIELSYLKVFLVGPPGVGKTTTLNRLLKEYENLRTAGERGKRRSTLFANCTQVLAFVGKDNAADWLSSSSGDSDEEAILLIQYLRGGMLKQKSKFDAIKEISQADSKPNVESKDKQNNSFQTDGKSSHPTVEEGPMTVKPGSLPQHLLQMKESLRKLVQEGDYTKAISHLGNTLLNINDVGGQPGFLEMLPALNKGPAMYLVFLDLSKELNQPYQITFDRDDTVITPFKSLHTVESTIAQILSSIASAHCISRDLRSLDLPAIFGKNFQNFIRMQPIAALVGTHIDKLDDKEKKIKEASERLQKVTQKYDKIFVTPESTIASVSPLFFPVNNYDGEEAEDIAPIRAFMNEIFQSRFRNASLPVPKKWLILNIILRREYRIVEMNDCFEICEMLDIDKEKVKFCLWYLDCIGTLMYYANIHDEDGWFKNHVICSPQVIFDSISQLIVASMCTLHSGGHVTVHERKELISKGQFSIETIEMHCEQEKVSEKLENNELIPTRQLIQLLEHVNLLSPIIHNEADGERTTYLMPAVLDCASLDDLNSHPPLDANNPEPLFITFTCGYVPTGTFCGLITRLVSQGPSGILGLEWDLVEDDVKRNYVSFYVNLVNKVTLLCHDRCYEIRVVRNDQEQSLHDLCTNVLSVIQYNLRILYSNLNLQIAFHCPCSAHAASKNVDNLCTLVESTKIRFLCRQTRAYVDLQPAQYIWFSKVVTPGCFAELEVLKNAENEFSFHWTKEGSRRQIKTTSESNVLTFQSVSEKSLGYYRCEVREAGKVVLTVYRALYKDESICMKEKQKEASLLFPSSDDIGLTHKEVVELTKEARACWFDLGIELDIDLDTLQAIRKENNNRVDDCLAVMLKHWVYRHAPSPSWSALVEALSCNVIGRFDIATIVKSKYKTVKLESFDKYGFTLKWIRRVTWEVRSNWRDLGAELDVDCGTLEAIRKTHQDIGDCYTEMLSHWLKRSTPPPSWEQLVEALSSPSIEREDIGQEITARWSES